MTACSRPEQRFGSVAPGRPGRLAEVNEVVAFEAEDMSGCGCRTISSSYFLIILGVGYWRVSAGEGLLRGGGHAWWLAGISFYGLLDDDVRDLQRDLLQLRHRRMMVCWLGRRPSSRGALSSPTLALAR
jgi:hypothetical protein